MVSKKTLDFIAKSRAERDRSVAGRMPRKSAREKAFEAWKEYGNQFTEEEKRSYFSGYKHAVQDMKRLAHGGADAGLVRNYALRLIFRAVANACIQHGIDISIGEVEYRRLRGNDPYNGAADGVLYISLGDRYSLKKGVPLFDDILNEYEEDGDEDNAQSFTSGASYRKK